VRPIGTIVAISLCTISAFDSRLETLFGGPQQCTVEFNMYDPLHMRNLQAVMTFDRDFKNVAPPLPASGYGRGGGRRAFITSYFY